MGGHSVRDEEIKYGMSVTGVVDPARMMNNSEAKPGAVLVLTKALGTGFITTALKANRCPDDVIEAACQSMSSLNKEASEAAVSFGVKAATDITGFGLAGHGLEMAAASEVTIELDLQKLPILPGAEELAAKGNRTRANPTNRAHVEPSLKLECDEADPRLEFLFDPQTSGGLLVAIDAARAEEFVTKCHGAGIEAAAIVGRVVEKGDAQLVIRP